jgi:hypothetical protein
MMHSQIEKEEIVERYVQRQLPPEMQQAFEDHFFECDECFAKLQEVERFRAGVRDASARGLLPDESLTAAAAGRGGWLRWAFAMTSCSTAALVAIAGWMYFRQIPALRGERDQAASRLQLEREARSQSAQAISPAEGAEANVALVMLQASRAGEKPPTTVLQPGAQHVVVWIEIGPSRYRSFRIDLLTPDNRPIASVDRLERGPYGALTASLPADKLPAGDLRITLSGQDPPPASLVADYQLRIEKR